MINSIKITHTPKVLIVEDDPVCASALVHLLQSEAIEAYRTATVQATRAVLSESFDLILLDVFLEDGHGKDVLKLIERVPALEDVPVICLTASENIEDIVGMFEAGAMDYVIKPFNQIILKSKIRNFIKLKTNTDHLSRALDSLRTANQELTKTRDEAEKAANAQSAFLANMSHEIRNPLNALLGMLDDLDDAPLDHSYGESLRAARSAGDHLVQIVDDILDLKKIHEGKLDIVPNTVDLHQFVKDIDSTVRQLSKRKGLEFQPLWDIEHLPRFVTLDRQRVNQILFNLVSNALKFTEKGTIAIGLRHDNATLLLQVADTGIGMTDDTLSRIFRRFMQADSTTSKRYGGSGLGLSIVNELVSLMQGSIDVSSNIGSGTTFTVTLPASIEHKASMSENARVNEDEFQEDFDLTGKRVLCVDDSSINLKVLSKPLIKAGALVTTTASAIEALPLVRSADFDIVITDISMPEMDGEELQAVIHKECPGLPVIAVTGNVIETDVRRYSENGFAAVLAKPLDASELMRTVTACLKHPEERT